MNSGISFSCKAKDCDRTFGSRGARDTHFAVDHSAGDPLSFACPANACEASFGTKANLQEHQRLVHGVGVEVDMDITYGCHELTCRESFTSTDERDAHYLKEHHQPQPAPAELEDEFTTGTCDWGGCDEPSVTKRMSGVTELDVCAAHAEPAEELEPSSNREASLEDSPAPHAGTETGGESGAVDDAVTAPPVAGDPEPEPDDKGERDMAVVKVSDFECDQCDFITPSETGLKIHKGRKHPGTPMRSSASTKQTAAEVGSQHDPDEPSTSDEGTEPEEDTAGDMPDLGLAPDSRWGILFELSPQQEDVVDAVAFLRRETSHQVLQGILSQAIDQAGDDDQVRQLVAVRGAREEGTS